MWVLFILLILAFLFIYIGTFKFAFYAEKYFDLLKYRQSFKLKRLYQRWALASKKTILEKYGISKRHPLVMLYSYKLFIGCGLMVLMLLLGYIIFGIICFMLMLFIPDMWISQKEKKLLRQFVNDTPVIMEIIAVYMQSGVNFERALTLTQQNIAAVNFSWSYQLNQISANNAIHGLNRSLELFCKTFYQDDILTRFTNMVITSLNTGTPMVEGLLTQAAQIRETVYLKTEEKMASLAVKLTIPMILFFLLPIPITILAPNVLMTLLPALQGFGQ